MKIPIHPKFIFTAALSLLVAYAAGYSSRTMTGVHTTTAGNSESVCTSHHAYINPFLCELSPYVIEKKEYVDLRLKLVAFIDSQKKNGTVTDISVFFRDLEQGPTMGINERLTFAPASLLKVPILITYLKLAESNPDILNQAMQYTGIMSAEGQSIAEDQTIHPNTPYTVSELLRRMIVFSDNRSRTLLKNGLSKRYPSEDMLLTTYIDLGIISMLEDTANTMTVKRYSGMLRQLYHASYLSAEMSEKALQLMTESVYTKALAAGIPSGTKIAHKFGEGAVDGIPQLHDCGIIYFPDNPYLLCIMTRGQDASDLPAVISTISRMVYEEVDGRRIGKD